MAGQRTLDAKVEIELFPERGLVQAEADLILDLRERGGDEVHFLLNPGFRVESASIQGRPALVTHSQGHLTLRAAEPFEEGRAVRVEVCYGGEWASSSALPGWFTRDQAFFPMMQFWYPCDLQGFMTFQFAVTVPDDWTVVSTGIPTAGGPPAGNGRHTESWREVSPVLGASLAAGRFAQSEGRDGAARYVAYSPVAAGSAQSPSIDPRPYLDAARSAYAFCQSEFGQQEGNSFALVLSDRVERVIHGGNPMAVVPAEDPDDGEALFLDVARAVAHQWWGGRVAGRWLTARDEGSAWVVDGLAEHAAWQGFRNRYGRAAYLQLMEQLRCPESIPVAMKSLSLLDGLDADGATRAFIDVRGPLVARML
ncbi:MAG: hypothetical protein JXR94_17670, partial [Candidatus Hydrogenedentes bacterium]|nr:hypothetical protein [Candidatus Hydrogenedentota bacterium]